MKKFNEYFVREAQAIFSVVIEGPECITIIDYRTSNVYIIETEKELESIVDNNSLPF